MMKNLISLITICCLTGCGITPDTQPPASAQNTKPCIPDTVFLVIDSSAWWGVLPTDITPLDTNRWYWNTEHDTVTRQVRTVVMRHATPKRDTVVDIQTEVLYRDSTGRWSMIADSLAHELALMDGTLAKSRTMIFWFLGIVMALAGSGMAFFHYKLKRHELGTE